MGYFSRRALSQRSVIFNCERMTFVTSFQQRQRVVPTMNTQQQQKHPQFAKANIGEFFQEQPQLHNQFLEDASLQKYLKRYVPDEKVYKTIAFDLSLFGDRVSKDIYHLSRECEQSPPKLQHYNAWGQRTDEIVTSEAWKKMKTITAEEGIVATAYERKYGSFSRLYQMAKLYLFCPSSGLYSCPVAMTDGAARTLELLQDSSARESLKQAFTHLTSRNPNTFWTSGQWMTERKGGSDVGGGCETVACPQPDGSYILSGYKWFSSATDSEMAFTLARITDQTGQTVPGSKGLSMFYLETRRPDGQLNGLQVQRLKDKLGTRQLPTAELLLDGTQALLVSDPGRGVAAISTMLTLTRLHNAASACGFMRRILNLARDYSVRRECFGRLIKDYPLHVKTLANLEIEARAALLLTLELARLLGIEECSQATDDTRNILRLLMPAAKLYTAKQAMSVVSEGLECIGGPGYLEDTGLPVLLRDAQVLPIWEGTTNILSLDILRAISKSNGTVLQSFLNDVTHRMSHVQSTSLEKQAEQVVRAAKDIVKFAAEKTSSLELAAREFAFSLARTYMGMLLIDHANTTGLSDADVLAAERWCEKDLTLVLTKNQSRQYTADTKTRESALVFDGYTRGRPCV